MESLQTTLQQVQLGKVKGKERESGIEFFPNEIVVKIFEEVSSIRDFGALLRTHSRFYHVWQTLEEPQKARTLYNIIATQYDPIHEAVQLVTYDGTQLAHLTRQPEFTMDFIKKLMYAIRVVNRWADVYPQERWRFDFHRRRVLSATEIVRFRNAMYRSWLYDLAFNSSEFVSQGLRAPRPFTRDPRMVFLRHFKLQEILEMAELNDMLRQCVSNDICPSDDMIRSRYYEGFAGHDHNVTTFPAGRVYRGVLRSVQVAGMPARTTTNLYDIPEALADEAWGSEYAQLAAVDDVMKLTPDDLYHLREGTSTKAERVAFLKEKGPYFKNEKSHFGDALASVFFEADLILPDRHNPSGYGILDVPIAPDRNFRRQLANGELVRADIVQYDVRQDALGGFDIMSLGWYELPDDA